jgi:hypothetical protein
MRLIDRDDIVSYNSYTVARIKYQGAIGLEVKGGRTAVRLGLGFRIEMGRSNNLGFYGGRYERQ